MKEGMQGIIKLKERKNVSDKRIIEDENEYIEVERKNEVGKDEIRVERR